MRIIVYLKALPKLKKTGIKRSAGFRLYKHFTSIHLIQFYKISSSPFPKFVYKQQIKVDSVSAWLRLVLKRVNPRIITWITFTGSVIKIKTKRDTLERGKLKIVEIWVQFHLHDAEPAPSSSWTSSTATGTAGAAANSSGSCSSGSPSTPLGGNRTSRFVLG